MASSPLWAQPALCLHVLLKRRALLQQLFEDLDEKIGFLLVLEPNTRGGGLERRNDTFLSLPGPRPQRLSSPHRQGHAPQISKQNCPRHWLDARAEGQEVSGRADLLCVPHQGTAEEEPRPDSGCRPGNDAATDDRCHAHGAEGTQHHGTRHRPPRPGCSLPHHLLCVGLQLQCHACGPHLLLVGHPGAGWPSPIHGAGGCAGPATAQQWGATMDPMIMDDAVCDV